MYTGGYVVQPLDWRSDLLNQLIMDIDDMAILLRYDTLGVRGRGALVRPRFRLEGLERVIRDVPYTFPRNCYHDRWINALSPKRRAAFERQCGAPVNLVLDPAIKE